MADEDDDEILDKEADDSEAPADDDKELESEADEAEKPEDKSEEGKLASEEDDEKEAEKEEEDADIEGEKASEEKSPKEEINENADELLSSLPKDQVPVEPESKLDRYQNFINEYRKLQGQRQKADVVAGLMAAGGKIGQSIAGKYSGNFTPDLTGAKMVQEAAARPVQDLELQQAVMGKGMQLQSMQQSNDPTSAQSKLIRQYLNQRLGMNLPDNVSASDAMMLMKSVGRPVQTKYQKVNGTYTDDDGTEHRISANYDPTSHSYVDVNGNKLPDNFVAEGLNPYQFTRDPITGNLTEVNKSRGGAPKLVQGAAPDASTKAQTSDQLFASMNPNDRKELSDKIMPAFNKETEKTQQRLNHVPIILRRLQDAQTNPAALPQLKAELARFDVGDQRLAVQELNMFAQRQGYKGWGDLVNAKTTGTISSDFANDMASTIGHVADDLKGTMSDAAERHAQTMLSRMQNGDQVNKQLMAKLVYGGYKPSADKVKVRNIETGVVGTIPKANLQKALDSKKYIQVQ